MNQIIMKLQLLAACVLFAFVSAAQQTPKSLDLKYKPIEEPKWSMFNIFRVHLQDFAVTDKYNDTCNCLESTKFLEKANANVGLSFYKSVDDNLAYSVDMMLGYGYVARKSPTAEEKERSWLGTARADVYYHLMSSTMQLRPYVFGALHSTLRQGALVASLPVGAGARYMFFNNQAMITAQVGYGLGLTNRIRNNVIYSSGLYVNLNKKHKPRLMDLGTPADGVVTKMHPGQSSCYNCGAVVDTDCDGVTDAIDKCPTVPGLASNNGCPVSDRDGDGVLDQMDKCPDVAGPVNNEGCPVATVSDRDKDGVVDQMDKCPDIAGIVSNDGCPAAAQKNQAKDRILEKPEQPSASDGILYKSKVANTTESVSIPQVIVYFDTDKSAIRKDAQVEIERAAAFLSTNMEYVVILKGHTDPRASYAYNESLSKDRANAVKTKLLEAGVAESRIKVAHFGEVTPVKTGDGEPNWQRNRRVEFTFVLR